MMSNILPPVRTTRASGWQIVGLFLLINLLVQLPGILLGTLPLPVSTEAVAFYWEGPLRLLSLDLFALVSLLALIPPRSEWGEHACAFAVGTIGVLFGYEAYEAIVATAFHRNPLFYADLPHLAGAVYLLYNTISFWQGLFGVTGGVALIYTMVQLMLPAVTHLHRLVWAPRLRWRLAGVSVIVWSLVAFAAVTGRGIERQTYQSVCLSTTEALVRNIQESWALRTRTAGRQSQAPDSTYVSYRDLSWDRPPSLYLVVMESYGTVVSNSDDTQEAYGRLMGQLSDSLGAAEWHTATAQSKAPVFGGLSWLSVASILLGTSIEHQPTYEMIRPTLRRYPHLVSLLQKQGYRTAVLQPPVRQRPGLQVENHYGFDQTFYFSDLNYRGPDYGWGIVPDQYSLSVAHEQFVERTSEPFFLLFETVGSHIPLDRAPPPLVKDAEVLNQSRALATTARHTRQAPVLTPSVGAEAPQSQTDRLLRHLGHTWKVLADYLRSRAPQNSLVLVVGDHQPYFGEGPPSTPVHVLSRDSVLVQRFHQYGFASGLRPSSRADTLRHAGLYSLLTRTITAHEQSGAGHPSSPLPPYRPEGVQRAKLLPAEK